MNSKALPGSHSGYCFHCPPLPGWACARPELPTITCPPASSSPILQLSKDGARKSPYGSTLSLFLSPVHSFHAFDKIAFFMRDITLSLKGGVGVTGPSSSESARRGPAACWGANGLSLWRVTPAKPWLGSKGSVLSFASSLNLIVGPHTECERSNDARHAGVS